MFARLAHIAGILAGLAAGAGLIIVGATGEGGPNGQMITLGVAAIIAVVVAILDGARALPDGIGLWKIEAKFSGLSDLGVIIIIVVMGAGVGLSFAFT